MKLNSSNFASCFTLVILVLLYMVSFSLVECNRDTFQKNKKNVGLWDLPPLTLSLVAGEYRGLLADILNLEAGAKIGTKLERTSTGKYAAVLNEYDPHVIHKVLVASQMLDPYFQQTFMVAQGWLPWDGELVEETNAILKIAQKNRYWDFFPTQFTAFNTYYFLNDYKKAGEILLHAAAKKNAPPHFAIIGSRLSHKGGDTKAAIVLMKLIVGSRVSTEPGFENLQKRLNALEAVQVLEQAVSKYQQRFSSFPSNPSQLIQAGMLSSIPLNPYGLPYCINQTGDVFFDRPDCRKLQK